MNNTVIEELENSTLTSGVETELVFKEEIIEEEELYGYFNHHNRYVNPLYRHCDLGGE
jgi:hypothetical protein